MDNPYWGWSPLPLRPRLEWPGGARVALCVIVSLEHVEWIPPADAVVPPSTTLNTWGPYPRLFDPHEISHHEYGNRVGVFRVMEVLDRLGVRATVAMDAALAERNPFLVEECRRRGWEFIGHGVAFSRMLHEGVPEAEERAYLQTSLATLERVSGQRPQGWVGADYGESSRTVRLLAELGVRYVCDWPNDEQPYLMRVPKGEIVSLPVSIELDEVFTHRMRGIPITRWGELVREAFDCLYRDGADSGRLLVLNLHPYLIGQPFRIRHLEESLQHILRRAGVWAATGSEITNWYLAQEWSAA
jgi:peptidoglycan/xylan/chitin deacetylase (PgdA/CDA1 family)